MQRCAWWLAMRSGRWLWVVALACLLGLSIVGQVGAQTPPGSSSAAPAPSSSADSQSQPATITLRGTDLFKVQRPRAGRSPMERAGAATKLLDAGFEGHTSADIRTETRPEGMLVLFANEPLILLTQEDALAAGDSNLDEFGAATVARMRAVFDQEKQRSNIAHGVFSFSLVVFLGLIAFFLTRKLSELAARGHVWLEENPSRVPALRLQRIEIAGPALLRTSLELSLGVVRRVGQVGLLYLWLVVSLSLFEATRGYTKRLTGVLLTPLSELMSRLAASLPLFVVALTALLAVVLTLRFVGLFFETVSRGESDVAWLPRDFARPVGLVVRGGLVIATLVFAAPVITGDSEGALARSGTVLLVSIGLAGVPLLATAMVGGVTVFGRRLKLGELVETDGVAGRITRLGLLDLDVETDGKATIRVPHLLTLTRPLRRLAARPLTLWVTLPRTTATTEGAAQLLRSAQDIHTDTSVNLREVSEHGTVYVLHFNGVESGAEADYLARLAHALEQAEIAFKELRP
ncbi:MAG: hypothetical protein AB7K71_27670 [Polyangiaceae bacterium]